MSDRLLVDHGRDGRVSVRAWLDGEFAPGPASRPFEMSWPLDIHVLEELRWYLEDYLRAPFGVYGDRGARVAARLDEWGNAVFQALVGSRPAHDAYVRVRERKAGAEVVLRSIGQRINLQARGGQAKPYQLRQLLDLVERHALRLKENDQ